MLLLEDWARPLLLLHGIIASVLVASATHHLLWCRRLFRGGTPPPGERRFARIAAIAYLATFLLGNLLYPTYKVRVRAAYLDAPTAIAGERALRAEAAIRLGHPVERIDAGGLADRSSVARLFDIKEHWVALGCAASLLLAALSFRCHPGSDRRVRLLYLGLSLVVCATAWTGAVIGLLTTSVRAVGAA